MIALRQTLYVDEQAAVNKKAIAWTVAVHAFLLLLFVLLRYTIATPPPTVQDLGMEVNLGSSDNGSGNDQPMSTQAPAPYQADFVDKSTAQKADIPKDIERSTDA